MYVFRDFFFNMASNNKTLITFLSGKKKNNAGLSLPSKIAGGSGDLFSPVKAQKHPKIHRCPSLYMWSYIQMA
jgi:hypothetical protein